jgi:flagellar assembly protein FliH
MFLSSTPWTKFELETLDRAAGEENKAKQETPGEFIPLASEEGGLPGARKASDSLLRRAEEKAARLEQVAYDKGFSQGEKDGFEVGQKKAEKIVVNLEKLFEELSAMKKNLVKSYEKELLSIVLAIAKKVVHQESLKDDDLIERTVLHALRLAADRSEISLRIHPDDVELIDKLRPGLFAEFKDLKGLSVSPDPSISRGGCVLESPSGDLDGRIETQLEQITQVMDEAFREQGA